MLGFHDLICEDKLFSRNGDQDDLGGFPLCLRRSAKPLRMGL